MRVRERGETMTSGSRGGRLRALQPAPQPLLPNPVHNILDRLCGDDDVFFGVVLFDGDAGPVCPAHPGELHPPSSQHLPWQ